MSMNQDVLTMIESMAAHGTAPPEGCSLFGVGCEDAFSRLRHTYLKRSFSRGASTEKFVIGPFGSGKSHFLHQLMEHAREMDCASAKVTLNKDIDFTQNIIVFKEIVREFRLPGSNRQGIAPLIEGCVERVRSKADEPAVREVLVRAWISGLDQFDFDSSVYAFQLQQACRAYVDGNTERFSQLCRWLSGEFDDRTLCTEIGVSIMSKSEFAVQAKRASHTLFQFVKRAGFQGSVVCFDEAEQGFNVEKKKVEKIFSMLQAEINANMELKQGAVMKVYALTPDLISRVDSFAALQQRLSDPGPGQSFFEGNTYAPKIDLSRRPDMLEDLRSIAKKLVELMYSEYGQELSMPLSLALDEAEAIAEQTYEEDLSSSSRRTLVKRVCTFLLKIYETAEEIAVGNEDDEDEV